MTLLFLGYSENKIIDFLRDKGKDVVVEDKKLNLREIQKIAPNHIISYGYRHIITPDIIKEYPEIANLHIGYLPWNRGANPCFWSLLENTPQGYSIHYIDAGIDTGPILIQDKIIIKNEIIGRAYKQLKQGLEDLFINSWEDIAKKRINSKPQTHTGTFHELENINKYQFLLDDKLEKGDVLTKTISEYGEKQRLWVFDRRGNKIK